LPGPPGLLLLLQSAWRLLFALSCTGPLGTLQRTEHALLCLPRPRRPGCPSLQVEVLPTLLKPGTSGSSKSQFLFLPGLPRPGLPSPGRSLLLRLSLSRILGLLEVRVGPLDSSRLALPRFLMRLRRPRGWSRRRSQTTWLLLVLIHLLVGIRNREFENQILP
jgi:hypothetical protein